MDTGIDLEVTEEYEFPVSDAQSRLLVLEQLDPGSAQYHVPAAFAVRGRFHVDAFRGAMDALVRRHESLRTVFRANRDGTPVQIVSSHGRAAVRVEQDVPASEVDARMWAEAQRPFDIATGPLLRGVVYAVDDASHRVLLVAHHLICDGWSLQVILRDLSEAYRAVVTGLRAELPEPSLQFGDFAVWQRERLGNGDYQAGVEHWAQQLRGAPETVPLPLDRPRPAVRSTAGGRERFPLDATLRRRLAQVARTQGATPFIALFAGYAGLLGRLTGSEDLVVGFPVSCRDRPELQDLVGMLANTVALRVDLSGDPSYGELIGRVRDQLRASGPFQEAPFEAVVDAVAPARVTSHDPVVQVFFGYDDDTDMTLRLAGAETSRVVLDLDAAMFDLHLQVERWGDDLAAQLIYRGELFEAATARAWVRSFTTLLDELSRHPGAPLSQLEAVPAADRARVLAAADHTAQAAPADRLVVDLVAEQAERRPDATALVCGAVRLTYRELMARADGLAARLRGAGAHCGAVVGLLLPRSAEMGIAALAVLRAGGAYLPLETANPRSRLAHMVADSRAALVLACAETAELAAGLGASVLRVDESATPESDPDATLGALGERQPAGPAAPAGPGDLAYVIYTSGSTGVPKGVAVEHRALANLAYAVRHAFHVTDQDRVLQYVSFGFDVAVSDLFFCWAAGAELHIAAEHERLGDALVARLRESAISYAFLPPSAAMMLPPDADLPHLRTLAVGGEACPAELVQRHSVAGRRIVNGYGPTEAAVFSAVADLRPGAPVVIGQAVPGAAAYVLDARLRPVPAGVAGEIYVAGALLARGYIGQAAMTAERFVADPHGPPGSRMYRTGDLGRIDACGALHYLGRGDTQVKLRGFRIELGEIEAVLAGVPGVVVAAAAVHGTGAQQRLVAYVVGTASDQTLRARLGERLPGYMVPDAFTHLDELPLNRSGKIDRSRLPAPAPTRPGSARSYAAPRGETEALVADVWARVLDVDRVGAHDNFFDLGGNSVRLLAMLTGLREWYGEDDLTLVDLFRHPTVTALAAHLDRRVAADDPSPATQRGSDRRVRRAAATQRLRNRKGAKR